ncbi:outer membrane protein assembly factor BamB family protein [Phaeacidiphilus oryzae]|uniref:outer membrane protein assembly factor BamB family protein n=1 Tax=Phaeacidiphilus oryzae TaxID=348818 RepID=UPI0006915A85|nr:PQQ-binding-like beta-propeller repeat protein [Phaeacidiphilus oryzae]
MGHRTRRGVGLLALVLLLVGLSALTGCEAGSTAGAQPTPLTPGASALGPPRPAAPGDWPVYHRDPLRTGAAAGPAPAAGLRTDWTAHLDGTVYGQPLLIRGRVLAATENDSVYALDPATGHVLWRRHLGTPVPLSELPCGSIDPLGITGTPAYDPATGMVLVVAETTGARHWLLGLDAGSGALRLSREVEPPHGDRTAEQQRAALAVSRGRVYIAYGGLNGDCGRYLGSVLSVPVTGGGPVYSFTVPTSREGGIWAPGGPVADGSLLYVAVGNGAATGGSWDGSDSVTALATPTLRRVGAFAPADWAKDNASDSDLGSLTPVRVGRFLLQAGKSGTVYLLDARHLGGIGGQLAGIQSCPAYGAAAVRGLTVYLPCRSGLQQITVGADGTLRTGWRFPLGQGGSPVLGPGPGGHGGAVWVADWGTGTLHVLDAATGRQLASLALGTLPHFVSPVLAGGRAYVGTTAGVTAIGGA